VEALRTFQNLVAFQQRTNREGPTRWNELEILEQSENRYEWRRKPPSRKRVAGQKREGLV
jgi:hypothetical protein